MNHPTKSRGFTLVEMLVALTMAGAVVTPLYVITRGVAEQTSAKQMEIEAMQRARIGMDTLIRDFSRAGLFTSPNTAVDNRYINKEIVGSTARYRPALAHLNAGEVGPDTVLLAGNFLGNRVYEAYAEAENQLLLLGPFRNEADCTLQFSKEYAFIHISDNAGRELDAQVTASTYIADEQQCRVMLNVNDRDIRSYKTGDTVLAAANQTILYTVEGGALVRYFVRYTSPSGPNDGNCVPGSGGTDISLVVGTRKVIANFVTDFQVWFRAVTDATGWVEPHYPPLADVVGQNGVGANFADGLVPPSDQEVILLGAEVAPTTYDVTCKALQDENYIGPERVRSALIRLTVRTEKSEAALRRVSDDEATRLEKRLLAADGSITPASGQDPYAFMLRTMTTELEMPNLTARSDLL